MIHCQPKTENRKPDHSSAVRRMFSALVPWYDFLNRFLSLRRDVIWRRRLVAGLPDWPAPFLLDLAAGTLDVTLELARRYPKARFAAGDFSLPMLRRGREKWRSRNHDLPLLLVAADALALPFPAASWDAVTVAFGIRNLTPREAALKEMHRVLKPGGWLAILEFGPPVSRPLSLLYHLYLNHLLPLLGRLFSRHPQAYQYLSDTIQAFPSPSDFTKELAGAGFHPLPPTPLTRGIAWVYYGLKK